MAWLCGALGRAEEEEEFRVEDLGGCRVCPYAPECSCYKKWVRRQLDLLSAPVLLLMKGKSITCFSHYLLIQCIY